MPGMDGTGPQGLGPGTGWGRGPCMAGRGFRRRFWRRAVEEPLVLAKNEEKKVLEEEADELELELKRIKEKLKEMR